MKPVTITGTVQRGKQLGRTIGYPTINLQLDKACGLAYGVYASRVTALGNVYTGMTNVGCHPTLPEGAATIETYIIGANLNLYGCEVTLELMEFIRPERKFESLEALKAQLESDKASIISWFEANR